MMLTTLVALAALHTAPEDAAVAWFNGSFEAAKAAAESEGKLLLTYFWADTPQCQQLYSQTMSDENVISQMNGMLCFSANVTEIAPREVFDYYGLSTIPAMLVSAANGQDLELMTGFMNPATFQSEFNRIANGINTIPDLRRKAEEKYAELDDLLAVRKMLADKLALLGKRNESDTMLADIKDSDLKYSTYTVALMRFNELLTEGTSYSQDPGEWKLDPVLQFVKKLPKKNKRARFDTQVQIGALQVTTGEHSAALQTLADAWKEAPRDYNAIGSGITIVNQLLSFPEELSSKQLKFAKTVAHGTLALVAEDHAKHCPKKGCDGKDRACESYAKDLQAANDGNNSGHFVTGRSTINRAFIEFLVAQTEHATGDADKAIEMLQLLVDENPGNPNFASTLNRYLHPDEELEVAGAD